MFGCCYREIAMPVRRTWRRWKRSADDIESLEPDERLRMEQRNICTFIPTKHVSEKGTIQADAHENVRAGPTVGARSHRSFKRPRRIPFM
jgi:hypothetical protein